MSEAEQGPWTLLERPVWKPVFFITMLFGILLFMSGASLSSPIQVGVSLLAVVGYIFLYDSLRLFIKMISERRSVRILSGLVVFGLGVWLSVLITQWGETLSAPRWVVFPIRFSIMIAFAGASGSALRRPKQPSGENANA